MPIHRAARRSRWHDAVLGCWLYFRTDRCGVEGAPDLPAREVRRYPLARNLWNAYQRLHGRQPRRQPALRYTPKPGRTYNSPHDSLIQIVNGVHVTTNSGNYKRGLVKQSHLPPRIPRHPATYTIHPLRVEPDKPKRPKYELADQPRRKVEEFRDGKWVKV